MSTPQTPAQAAQQSNRDDGGRYQHKTHAEAEVDLTGATAGAGVSTRTEPFARDVQAHLDRLQRISERYEQAEARRQQLREQAYALPPAQSERRYELYDAEREAKEEADEARTLLHPAVSMTAAAMEEDSDQIRQERIAQALSPVLAREYAGSPEYVAHLAGLGRTTLEVAEREGIGRNCQPVPRTHFQREMTPGTKIEVLHPSRGQWEPRTATKQNSYEMMSASEDGQQVHLGYHAGQKFLQDDQGNYMPSASEDGVPYAIFRRAQH